MNDGPMRIYFGDEIGPITNRICDKCGSFCYERTSEILHWWKWACRNCQEIRWGLDCHTQTQLDDRAAEIKVALKIRERERLEEMKKLFQTPDRDEEQMTLW